MTFVPQRNKNKIKATGGRNHSPITYLKRDLIHKVYLQQKTQFSKPEHRKNAGA